MLVRSNVRMKEMAIRHSLGLAASVRARRASMVICLVLAGLH
jgi:hypothetical protein